MLVNLTPNRIVVFQQTNLLRDELGEKTKAIKIGEMLRKCILQPNAKYSLWLNFYNYESLIKKCFNVATGSAIVLKCHLAR